ncbi:UvrD-helicase domain-containing protein [Treponema sp. OMZ 840]|uniref:UvrD-helicase domain-containing protein n=1 Tax=Treponema sp. OMZ 840 TaxID=244313 RepID=UPI003D917320
MKAYPERLHPLLEKGLNDEQKAAVMCTDNSVVAAGAGSGKTFVFARRFVHLIADKGFDIDSVLALTFTNKAASEMYERIYKNLKMLAAPCEKKDTHTPESEPAADVFAFDSAADKDADTDAVERSKKALAEFHKARIQTLDSYCASVLRSSSRLYGIRPDFTVDVQKIQEFVQKEALSFTLKHRKNPALQVLCALQPVDLIARDFFASFIIRYSSLSRPFDFKFFIEKQIQKIAAIWKESLALVDENAAPLADTADLPEASELLGILQKNRVDEQDIFAYVSEIQKDSLLPEKKQTLINNLEKKLLSFFDALYTLKKLRMSAKNKSLVTALRNAYDSLSAGAHYLLHFSDMLALIPLLIEFENSVNEWKRVSGTLSFSDVSSLALKVLIEHPDIRRAEKKRTRAVMIDEFQDNNEEQRDMLFLLAEHIERSEKSVPPSHELCPDKLFFVGDEKQSIYLFRGADVSVFRKLKDDLSASASFLSKNYRSDKALIDAFNTFFGGFDFSGSEQSEKSPYSVFLQKNTVKEGSEFPPFEAEYTRALAGSAVTSDNSVRPPVHFFLLNKEDAANEEFEDAADAGESLAADENEAFFISTKIASLIREGRYKARDIAVLFRSYSRQHLYEKYLRLQNIPYSCETVTGFFSDAPVNDIYYFLRLVVYPQDVHAFAAVLASPFVNLPLQAVSLCVETARKDAALFPVFFSEHAGSCLNNDELSFFSEGLHLYERIKTAAKTASCADILNALWYEAGYRYETLRSEEGALFAELYDYLYELACAADKGGKNLCGFVDSLQEIGGNQDRLQDMDIPLEREDTVRLMSIHKSKGLEFPVVFICGCSSQGRAAKNAEKIYADKEWGISFNFPLSVRIKDCKKNIFFDLMEEQAKQKKEAELRRLLYVAFTRAEREVYVSAFYSLNKEAKKTLAQMQDAHTEKHQDEKRLLLDELNALFEARIKKGSPDYSVSNAQYCVPNDTFFAFLLPVIVSLGAQQPLFAAQNKGLPFTLETIPLMSREDIIRTGFPGKKIRRKKDTADAASVYENTPCIETPVLQSPYRSPSQLTVFEAATENDSSGVFVCPSGTQSLYPEIDEIVHSFSNGEFAYNHFGTVAHAFAEAACSGCAAKIPPESVAALSDSQKQRVFAAAKKMAENFIQSDLGRQAKNAPWRKNEYAFKLRIDTGHPENADKKNAADAELILNGQMDLVFQTESGSLVVVDFKTDAHENPDDYVLQLAAYRRAAALMRNAELSQVKTYVYYLRSGNAADITNKTQRADLNAAVFDTENKSSIYLQKYPMF